MLVFADMVSILLNMLKCDTLFFIYVESSQFPFNISMSFLFNFRVNTSIFIEVKSMHMLSGFAQKFNNIDGSYSLYITFRQRDIELDKSETKQPLSFYFARQNTNDILIRKNYGPSFYLVVKKIILFYLYIWLSIWLI